MRDLLGPHGFLRNLGGEVSWWWRRNFTRAGRKHVVYTDLDPRHWHDEDTRMLHACMAILGEYLDFYDGADELDRFSDELEAPPDPTDATPIEVNRSQASRQREATAIWRWWTIERPADQARENELLTELYSPANELFETQEVEGTSALRLHRRPQSEEWESRRQELQALEIKILEDEQSYLHRLIDIRSSLWT